MSLSPSLLLRSLRIPSLRSFSLSPPTSTSWASSTASPRDGLGAESAAAKEARERIERPEGWRSAKKFERREREQRERELKKKKIVLNYEPTDSHWHTHLPPPLTSIEFSSLTPSSRSLHLACRQAFLSHQQSLFDSLVPFKSQSEWESLTPEEKVVRKEVQKEKRVALFGLLGEREERTMWAVVQKKEKERRKRESRKREKKEAERVKEEQEREKLEKKGVVEEEEVKTEEVVKEEEEMKKKELIEPQSNVDVDAPPPLVEEEIENPWGAGIPLEARRGRRR
ncbi:hypothetical protein BDY24DRAFT_392646 [Mrakia frigida]|uniref:uncharacterized protein n=1 Tax=Mrakia frigida TaxID=29902 RepID=UPI003FCC16FB